MQKECKIYDPSIYAKEIFNRLGNRFGPTKEEDAHEFLGYLLEHFGPKLKQKVEGTQEQMLVCQSCTRESKI